MIEVRPMAAGGRNSPCSRAVSKKSAASSKDGSLAQITGPTRPARGCRSSQSDLPRRPECHGLALCRACATFLISPKTGVRQCPASAAPGLRQTGVLLKHEALYRFSSPPVAAPTVKAPCGSQPVRIFDKDTMNAPWGIVTRLKTAVSAVRFFNPLNGAESRRAIGQDSDADGPLSLTDFVRYLEKTDAFEGRSPNVLRVVQILDAMTREGILQNVGSVAGDFRFFNDRYLFVFPASRNPERATGPLWLAPVVGFELLYHTVGDAVVQIAGLNSNGDETSGSGLALSGHTVLTARHVVEDMQVHEEQVFQGVKCRVNQNSIAIHDVEDVACIKVKQVLRPAQGLILHPPRVGQKVFMLGYPRVPCVLSAPLVMHSGEVTTESVPLVNGERAFLYSATTRPGNSGVPSSPPTDTC